MAKRKAVDPQEQLDHQLSEIRKLRIAEPTIIYKVGQRVQRGAIDHADVAEVLDGGKVLRINETWTARQSRVSEPFEVKRVSYVAWHDVEPWKDFSQEKPFFQGERYHLSYYQSQLRTLFGRHYFFGTDYAPEYQRGFVWELSDKVKLIESIFQEVDIGKFVYRHLPFAPHPAPSYEIVDGKQRVNALIEFFEGRFRWRGTLFRDLHPRDRSHFENYSVSVADLDERSTKEHVLNVFIRLNTAGRPQDPSHLDKVRKMLSKSSGA